MSKKRKIDFIDDNIKKKEKLTNNSLKLVREINLIKNNLIYNLNKCDKLIKQLEKIIYKNCNHIVIRDFSSSGPGERAIKICKKCNLIMNEYLYK